ncbi:Flavodoxin [Elusimicrobium minutum Pei191]|uniref:Flavodoxin n=1 Tax=Elusimicrobium minutum (strain Pei191) TaxID=445932 RepID=B2KD37_ELUMP|nr:flavodoxin [Elusimicrobium minutum]ACC98433.1 Flavodoxin [Elusimicrobium minutum Pei191]
MSKISVVYWSGTGNTEMMANAIADGARQAGADVKVYPVGGVNPEFINSDIIVLGCPSMGAEVLEESEMEPFMSSLEGNISGKKVALFGSYDWGTGQWMRDWEERVKAAGANLVAEGLTINLMPDAYGMTKCEEYGKTLAAS